MIMNLWIKVNLKCLNQSFVVIIFNDPNLVNGLEISWLLSPLTQFRTCWKLPFFMVMRKFSRCIWNFLDLESGECNGIPLQHSCLENPMDGGAWWAAVHGVDKSWTRLSDFTFTFHFHALEKEMATHSSVLAWRIPGTGEPRGLPSMGLHRVGHDWSDLAAAAVADLESDIFSES